MSENEKLKSNPTELVEDEEIASSPDCTDGTKTVTEVDGTPGVIRSRYTPRFHSRSMLGSIKDFFTIMKPAKSPLPSTQALHSRTFNSEEQLISREEHSYQSKELVGVPGPMQSPIDSVDAQLSRSVVVEGPEHTFRNMGSQILREEPRFSDTLAPSVQPRLDFSEQAAPFAQIKVESSIRRATAIVSLQYDDNPLSVSHSVIQHNMSTSSQSHDAVFFRSAFLKRKLSRARLLSKPHYAFSSISETWVLPTSSKADVLGHLAVKEQLSDRSNYAFAYLVKSEEEEVSEGTQSTDRSENLYKRFAHLSLRHTSKEAYLMLLPVAHRVVVSHFVTLT